MAKTEPAGEFGRRERQIMDIIHRLGRASVADVLKALPDPPTYSSVRSMLGLLEQKGYLTHEANGLRYIYRPTVSRATARRTALRHLVRTFFDGSVPEAAASLLELSDARLSPADKKRLAELIGKAQEEGR
jgi:BlaI family transcriptional regulator, penicillinase repressor